MSWLPTIILFAPLAAVLLNLLFFRSNRAASAGVSIAACLLSFVAASWLFQMPDGLKFQGFTWMELPGLKISFGYATDRLARLMLLIVTGVGLLIHIFAVGYMREDSDFTRFFTKLSLFMFSMLGIVLSNNLVMMFIFWELVGLSSYLLIGFWYQRPAAAEASKKAFIVNRVGDLGFLIGILLLWAHFGSVHFGTMNALLVPKPMDSAFATLAALCLFCGCVGKSAQFPLHVWLPDAMEGPTPVSALIHAATMVAAGVYMLCRVLFLIGHSGVAMLVIAIVGAITALFAALIALQQNDIKRILAYSTLSQLGYMVMAVGVGAWDASMFHLATHAFFKALLFLAAGSVIHSLHHEQDIWKMGGLLRKMPVTSFTFLIGTLALMGLPPLSGFFSKETILAGAFHYYFMPFNWIFFSVGVVTAVLTAFYMTRLYLVAFMGEGRSHSAQHAHESPMVMTGPLLWLAVLSVIGGFLGMQDYLLRGTHHEHPPMIVLACSIGALIAGASAGLYLYHKRESDPVSIPILAAKFHSDEIYQSLIISTQDRAARIFSWVDRWIVEGLMIRCTSVAGIVCGEILRLFQGGNLKAYVILFILGVLFLFYWVFWGVLP